MSGRWMRIETDFVDHPKVARLAAAMGCNDDSAGWIVLRAWSWMSRFCPVGHFWDIDGTALEQACRWHGEGGKLLAKLVEVGFLDVVPGGFEAHDWAEHQGKVAATAEKERERKREYRARAGNVPTLSHGTTAGTNTGRPAQRDETRRDETRRKEEALSSALDLLPSEPPTPPVDAAQQLTAKLTDDEFQVFEHWRQTLGHPKAVASPERRRLLAKWLPIYGVERLQTAISGCSRSPHHMGQNDRHTRYDSLELILRDAKNIESFEQLSNNASRVA